LFLNERNDHMKKLIGLIIVGFCLLGVVSPSYADYDTYKANIKEGLGTMIRSPQPLVDSVKEEYNAAKFKPFGVFGGFIKGSFYSIKELSLGVLQILTFNVDDDNMFADILR